MNYYFFFYLDNLLLSSNGELPRGEVSPLPEGAAQALRPLPAHEGCACFAAQLQRTDLGEGWQLVGLRECFSILPPPLYKLAGKARELLYWHSTTRYCGLCGGPMEWHTDISKRCTHCGKEIWPSPATAVIVAVTRNEGREILLVQSKNFKRDYMGLVAGFVETGETLEEAVRREVREETRLEIRNLRYFDSQPWPFPNVLMAGFTAEYAGGTLELQRSELRKGGWFDRDHMPEIPGRVSLARRLIDHWLEQSAEA